MKCLRSTDGYYRTFEGFSVLVEREWLAFGHRFHDRLGYAHPSQRSPIFLLWLDALYQVSVTRLQPDYTHTTTRL